MPAIPNETVIKKLKASNKKYPDSETLRLKNLSSNSFIDDELASSSKGRINEKNSGFFKKQGDTSKSKFTRRGTDVQGLIDNNNNLENNNKSFMGYTGSKYSESGKKNTPSTLESTKLTDQVSNNQTSNVGILSIDPRVNRLHDYAPVNYIATLSCLSKERFNDGAGPETVILKSGGKGAQGSGNLNKDYYIDNIVIRNTLSPNEHSGTGSIFQLLFEVIEPYGSSFVDALIQAAGQQGYTSHLQAVYNLRIEFKGNSDDGQPTNYIPQTTRNIPIHIYQVELKIEAGVSTYALQCVPATQLGQTDSYAYTQETVTAKGDTVGDLIEDFLKKYSASLQSISSPDNKKVNLPDEYQLDIEQSMEEILKSPIGYTLNSSLDRIVTVSNIYDTATNKNFRSVTINKGTKIQNVIDAVIKDSRFYKDQLEVDGKPKNDILKIHKVETQLKIGADNGNGRNQYTFVYIIRKQEFTAELLDPNKNTADIVEPVREYNYLYTGKNQDVLDFDINYKFAYFQTIPYLKDKGNNNVSSSSDGKINDNISEDESQGTSSDGKNRGSSVEGVGGEVLNTESSTFIPGINDENGQAVDIMLQIIQNPTADLLVTNIEIIGDPYWIAQKTISNKSLKDSFSGTPNVDNVGAVATDESQVVVQVNFKTPTDLNDETGLFDNIQDSQGFQGKYRVYMAEHRFAGGIYTTVLQMVRMKNQPKPVTSQIGQSANSLGANNYSYEPTTTIGQSANSLGATGYTYNPSTTIGQSANSLGSDSYVTGITTNNVTRVPIGSNIAGGKRRGFIPEGFSDDLLSNLPVPKIDITRPYYSDAETMERLVKQKQGKSSRIRGGI